MARTLPSREPEPEPIDDYLIDRDAPRVGMPATARALQLVNAFMLLVLAVVSFALFFIIATLLGVI